MHVAMLELGIVLDAILGALYHGRDDPGLLAAPHDVVAPPRPHPSANDRVELVLVRHARLVGRKPRAGAELRHLHDAAERLELPLGLAGDEHPPVLSDAVLARA